jgi:hypothetical protein
MVCDRLLSCAADPAALRKSGALPLLSQPQAQARRRQSSSVAGHLYHRRKRNVLASLHDDSCASKSCCNELIYRSSAGRLRLLNIAL